MTSHIAPIATHNDTHHVHLILLIKLNTISKSKLDGENTKFVGYPVYMADVITPRYRLAFSWREEGHLMKC